ncbi:MAG TPA: DUF3313 domain-containing protein [Syntrophales bacterium]|nr:DUF3313 domain-containing protein [Syntrophales bacterium]HOX93636.1 DUF3313 domain-containing protein [Syntrophales bacterium]HPI57833.1 DUF3313 domain-containing protein [Syntrophales bacterium]HPN25547.1 DUF3313 domain-containing protein [Syntrophales bacterium]HQM28493.1 DUF3313 domain-containing protein [Syntrophales bacterium]
MKKAFRVILSVVIGLAVAASTGFAEDIKYSGFLGNPSVYSLMKPGPEGGVKLRWMKEGVDPKKYEKFMVDSVIFFLSDQAEYKGIDPQEMKELCDEFNKALVAAFKDKYPIVADPGPNVMRIRIAITEIKPSRPGVSTVTSIVPVGLGVSLVKKGATGGWAGSGETGIEMMALDSVTDEILVLAVDQRKAEFEQRFSKWGSATDAFKFWSEKTVAYIDYVKSVKRETKK